MPLTTHYFVLVVVAATVIADNAFQDKQIDFSGTFHPRLLREYGATRKKKRDPNRGNQYDVEILPTNLTYSPLYAGQEVRLVVKTTFLNNATFFDDREGKFRSLVSPYVFSGQRNQRTFPAWNSSGPANVRIRVIAAFTARTDAEGTNVPCADGANHDVWTELWGVSPRVRVWGTRLVFAGFATFSVPPFPFRLCMKDVTSFNSSVPGTRGHNPDIGESSGWKEFENLWAPNVHELRVFRPQEPLLLFHSAKINYAGDYAALTIIPNSHPRPHPFGSHWNQYRFSTFDNIKLVPAGMPCSYEKASSSANRLPTTFAYADHNSYCGANLVNPVTGDWIDPYCPFEGSVMNGVPHTGTEQQNPLAGSAPADFIGNGDFIRMVWNHSEPRQIPQPNFLVGYLQLPVAGLYDVCVSTRSYRLASLNGSFAQTVEGRYPRDARPVWIKAYDVNSSSCGGIDHHRGSLLPNCMPRNTTLKVKAAPPTTPVTWSLNDDDGGTWSNILFSSSDGRSLAYTPATTWDHSFPRDFAHLRGGDQFRIVPISRFATPTAVTDFGDLYSNSAGTRLLVPVVTSEFPLRYHNVELRKRVDATRTDGADLLQAGEGRYVQYFFGRPGAGTQLNAASSGCFWAGDDNYGDANEGNFGKPGRQCCLPNPHTGQGDCAVANWCRMSDLGTDGPTASADLGGDARSSKVPWLLDGSGPRATGFIRLPEYGEFHVCYRSVGGNWRVLTPTVAAGNNSLIPKYSDGVPPYHYHLNDTAAGTWGPWLVFSRRNDLDTMPSTWYQVGSSSAQGSQLKLVRTTASCLTGQAYSRSESDKPGANECTPAQNAVLAPLCRGSQHASTAPRGSVLHYMRVPDYVSDYTFRVCFRNKLGGWHHLADNTFSLRAKMVNNLDFHPSLPAEVKFTISDRREATLGIFKFQATPTSAGPPLNSFPASLSNEGDMVRILLSNVTNSRKQVNCDLVFGSASGDTVTVTQQLYQASRTSANLMTYCPQTSWYSACHPSKVYQMRSGLSATYPYTDLSPAGNDIVALTEGTAAALVIPPRFVSGTVASYKICYKPAHRNWIEATDALTNSPVFQPRAMSSARLTRTALHLLGGSFRFFEIQSDPNHPIVWSAAIAKLVPFSGDCMQPAVGSPTTGNNVTSIAGVGNATFFPRGHGYVVDGRNDNAVRTSANAMGASHIIRAYLPLPTSSSPVATTQDLRLCFMQRSSRDDPETVNWEDLSQLAPIRVRHLGVGFVLVHEPIFDAMTTIRFMSGSNWNFHTKPGADMAKVVDLDDVCTDHYSEPIPSAVTSWHRGVEWNATTAWGVTDLGPFDAVSEPFAEASVVFDIAKGHTYKVCYKPETLPWMEVLQVQNPPRHLFPLYGSTIVPSASPFVGFTMAAAILGKSEGFTSFVVGGVTTDDSVTQHFAVELAVGPPAGKGVTNVRENYKVIRVRTPDGKGVLGAQCDQSAPQAGGYSLTQEATQASFTLQFQMPLDPGTYVFCYQRTSRDKRWYQPKAASGTTHGNPFRIAKPNIGFHVPDGAVAGGTTTIGVVDANTNITGWPQGALVAGDYVRLYDFHEVCGVNASTNHVLDHKYDSAAGLMPDPSTVLSTRFTSLPGLALPATGSWKVCYFRSQTPNVFTVSHGTALVGPGVWLQLPNVGLALGGGSEFLIVTQPAKLQVRQCPRYNMTAPKGRMRTGIEFRLQVLLIDDNGNVVPKTGVPVTLQDGNPSSRNTVVYRNSLGACRPDSAVLYGDTSNNLVVTTENGIASFEVSVLSACPAPVGCNLTFWSPGLSPSEPCRFITQPVPVQEVRVTYVPSSCRYDDPCVVRAAGMYGDGRVAHTSTDTITVQVSGSSAISTQARVNGEWIPVNFASFARLQAGFVTIEFTFSATSYTQLANVTDVSITVVVNGIQSNATIISLVKPVLRAVHIVDLYPVANGPIGFDPLTPTWEPDSSGMYFRGDIGSYVGGSSVVTAGPGYHIVAGQFYTAVLRAVGGLPDDPPAYLTGLRTVDPGQVISIDQTALMAAGNAVLSPEGCIDETQCHNVFSGVSWSRPKQLVTFRLKNARGCSKGTGGCRLTFQFGGATLPDGPTEIITPVRAMATRLDVKCATHDASDLSTATKTCPTSTVEKGWYAEVRAVDAGGNLDEYFQGEAIVAAAPGSPYGFTTVSAKRTQTATNVATAAFSNGVAVLLGLTTVKPCLNCVAEVFATWGAGVTVLQNTVTTPTTSFLSCAFATPVFWCDPVDTTNGCTTTTGYGTTPPTPTSEPLLYRDTTICVSAFGADAQGNATLYDTNWIWYHAEVVSLNIVEQFVLTDVAAGTSVRNRYKPMNSGKATFCFRLSANSMPSPVRFNILFHAQAFSGDHWTRGTGKDCSLPLLLQPKKLVGGIQLSGATGMSSIGTDLLAVEATAATTATTVTFTVLDHYGIATVPGDLLASEQAIMFNAVLSAPNTVLLTNAGATTLRGTIGVSCTLCSVAASQTLNLALTISGFSLGARIAFDLTNGGPLSRRTFASPTTATAITQSVTLFVIDAVATTTRSLVFPPSESPLRYWVMNAHALTEDAMPPAFHQASCYTGACPPLASSLLKPMCTDGDGHLLASNPANGTIKMYVSKVASGGSIDAFFEPVSQTQIDILTTTTVSIAIGTQLLGCHTGYGQSCAGDKTATVSQTITAYGTTLSDAVTAFRSVSDAAIRTTAFVLYGLYTSNIGAIDGGGHGYLTPPGTLPSRIGAFVATPVAASGTTVSGISTTGREIGWSVFEAPALFLLRDEAGDIDACTPSLVPCHATDTPSCAYDGTLRTASLNDIKFDYGAQPVFTGVAFPMSADVLDSVGNRVWSAAGSVGVRIKESTGCGNGGSLTTSGTTITNGRATFWVTFSAPCQACVIEVTFLPDDAQVVANFYSKLNTSSANLRRSSRPIDVRPGPPPATHAVLAASHVAPSPSATIATQISVVMQSRASIGRLSVASTQPVTVGLYNRIQQSDSGRNWWWDGNGGVIRPTTGSSPQARHKATVQVSSAATTVTGYFTKTCLVGCEIVVAFVTADGTGTGAFLLRHSSGSTVFSVSTQPTTSHVAGARPRTPYAGSPFGVAFWQTGSELANAPVEPIEVAGVVPNVVTGLPAAGTASFTVIDPSNGDGGDLKHTVVFTSATGISVGRFVLSRACEVCQLVVPGAAFVHPFTASARATHLRVVSMTPAKAHRATTTTIPAVFEVRAVDDTGAVDVLHGNANCRYTDPFNCGNGGEIVSVTIVGPTGSSAAPLEPMWPGFAVSASTVPAIQLSPLNQGDRILNGIGKLQVVMPASMSFGVPVFSTGTSLTSAIDPARPRPFSLPLGTLSVSKSTVIEQLSLGPVVDTFSVNTTSIIDVALVTSSGLIHGAGNNLVTLTCSCTCGVNGARPTAVSGGKAIVSLKGGHTRIRVKFYELTALCTLKFTAKATVASPCRSTSACEAILQVPVTAEKPDAWRYLRPTVQDNAGHFASLRYGSVGRTSFVTAQVQRLDAFNTLTDSEWCADCYLEIRPLPTSPLGCAGFATPGAGPHGVPFNEKGQATFAVQWRPSAASYRCHLEVDVRVGTTEMSQYVMLASPIGLIGWHEFEVFVCVPHSIRFTANISETMEGLVLETGNPYVIGVEVVDARGARCIGESQDSAIDVTVSVVTQNADKSFTEVSWSTGLLALNVNPLSTSASGVARGNNTHPYPARTSAKPVGGHFPFHIVVTNSSSAISGGRFALKFAASGAPLVGVRTIYTPLLSSRVKFDRVRFHPDTMPHGAVVVGRVLRTKNMDTTFRVQIVDALMPSWTAGTPLVHAPNVARLATLTQSVANVSFMLDPPVANNTMTISLVNGEGRWTNRTWTEPPGIYGVYVVSAGMISSVPVTVVAQLPPTAIGIGVPEEQAACKKKCTFSHLTVAVDPAADVNYVELESTYGFEVIVKFLDTASNVVLGEHDAVVMMTLHTEPGTAVDAGIPPGLAERGPFAVRSMNGLARFPVGFIGSTAAGNASLHTNAYFETWCPQYRPTHLLRSGETAHNPCWGMPNLTTAMIRVTDAHPPESYHFDPLVKAQRAFYKFQLSFLNELDDVDLAALVSDIAAAVRNATSLDEHFAYLSGPAVPLALVASACVTTNYFTPEHDLGDSVCIAAGNVTICANEQSSPACPPQVLTCDCTHVPSGGAKDFERRLTTSAGAGRRSLLQATQVDFSANRSRTLSVNMTRSKSFNTTTLVSVELYPDLNRAQGFAASTVFAVADEYQRLDALIGLALRQRELQWRFGIDPASIRRRPFDATLFGATPTPPRMMDNGTMTSSALARGMLFNTLGTLLVLFFCV